MEFLIEHWSVILAILVLIVVVVVGLAIGFFQLPTKAQLAKVREWLLLAVTQAETELGAGTGQIKLRFVYDMFLARFTWLSRIISFERFSNLVDEALEVMRNLLETNQAVKQLVVKDENKKDDA